MPERSEVRLADGVRLHVETSGPADAPVTVVLLHGWCLDRRTWHHQVAALSGARVIAYDARGHGRSGSTCLKSATLAQLGLTSGRQRRLYKDDPSLQPTRRAS